MRQLLCAGHGQLCVARCARGLSLLRGAEDPLVRSADCILFRLRHFFSTASGFGTIVLDRGSLRIQMIEGELALEKLVLTDPKPIRTLDWKITVRQGSAAIKNI